MGWCIFWILLSLFAVFGLIEALVETVQLLALRKNRSVRRATVRIVLAGEEPYPEYLLNTLSLLSDRLSSGPIEPILELVDGGMSLEFRRCALEYCEKNPWVQFTDGEEDDIIE
jgi:hypothetical protein